ncbi:hypothetical protein B0181_09280 [Moraxella caviae]|uniref:UDP-glucose 6-dehydrogenase n=2 Tax=Moraxella caviae TaxID=34060 RepID=A0A1S9ZX63_9GAMM|nr:UDP-glucose/GDP-mannose dehydrogenase family protein [Moraxella caviae]OOR87989.1 hypothetical protein B0181_09280 [Moraxella caviae]STZ09712.1 UDP-glucose 6-dehydrogenase ywqF [Moraxella caviae]
MPAAFTTNNPTKSTAVLIGSSIETLASAVALASLGKSVLLYSADFNDVVRQYAFEHEAVALFEMYVANGVIRLADFAELSLAKFDELSQIAECFWVFASDALFADVDVAAWLSVLNRTTKDVPVVLSGSGDVGRFDGLAKTLKRAFVYYVPFVFLESGQAYASIMHPSLWLVGEKTADSLHKLPALNEFAERAAAVSVQDIKTCEFGRMSIMSVLAVRVSLMNELSRLADGVGVDITAVSAIMGKDKRIGSGYLRAGSGFGGQTLPQEVANLQRSFGITGQQSEMIAAVERINTEQKELMFRKFWQHFDGFIDGGAVTIWGGGYKSGSGRTTNSAIHALLRLFWSYDITTYVSADEANDELIRLYGDEAKFAITPDPYATLSDSKALFVLSAPSRLDVARLNDVALPIFDGGNAFGQADIARLSGSYVGVGRTK